jgi:hypothetical protein
MDTLPIRDCVCVACDWHYLCLTVPRYPTIPNYPLAILVVTPRLNMYILVRSVKKDSCPAPQCTAWKLTSCAPHWKMHGLESTLPVGWCVGMWFDLYTWDLNFIWLWYLFQWYLLNAVIFFHVTTTITVRTYIRRWVRLFVLTINFAVLWSNRSKCCFRCMYRICSNKSWAQ